MSRKTHVAVWLVPLLIIAALLVTVVVKAIAARESHVSPTAQVQANAPAPSTEVENTPQKAPQPGTAKGGSGQYNSIGNVVAPVTMVVFSDFQCHFCARWHQQTLPKIISKYVNNGKVLIEFHDVAILGPDSQVLAAAAHAAGLQGKYTEYAQALFSGKVKPANPGNLTILAQQMGMSAEKFTTDMNVGLQVADAVTKEAAGMGVSSTPSFIINGTPLVGAQPFGEFVKVIEAALAKVGQH